MAGSALVLEVVEARITTSNDLHPTFEQAVVGSLQETGGMLGLLLILDGVLRYLAERKAVAAATVR